MTPNDLSSVFVSAGSFVSVDTKVPNLKEIDPWLVIGLAAHYQMERDFFDANKMPDAADQADFMLNAMMELAGMALHGDKYYFTWGPDVDFI